MLFFATLYWAPASRIFRRRSVDCATERPWLRVITTTLVSVKTCFSSSTRSAFCERSMPTPLSIEAGFDRGSTKCPDGYPPERQVSVGLGSMAPQTQRTTKRSPAPNDSCPRLGCRLSPSHAREDGSCLGRVLRGRASRRSAALNRVEPKVNARKRCFPAQLSLQLIAKAAAP